MPVISQVFLKCDLFLYWATNKSSIRSTFDLVSDSPSFADFRLSNRQKAFVFLKRIPV